MSSKTWKGVPTVSNASLPCSGETNSVQCPSKPRKLCATPPPISNTYRSVAAFGHVQLFQWNSCIKVTFNSLFHRTLNPMASTNQPVQHYVSRMARRLNTPHQSLCRGGGGVSPLTHLLPFSIRPRLLLQAFVTNFCFLYPKPTPEHTEYPGVQS